MKIAVSSNGNDLKSMLDPRFGRCAYFLIIDPEDLSCEVFDNQSASQSHGAGIQAAQSLADKNVTAVITGHVGPNAAQMLSAAGIDVFTDQQGTISDVVERFKKGNLTPAKGADVNSHYGIGDSAGTVRGRGMRQGSAGGRGMGQGVGRGLGRSGGMRQGQGGGRGRGMGRGGGMQRW